jgi:hypothetical protein
MFQCRRWSGLRSAHRGKCALRHEVQIAASAIAPVQPKQLADRVHGEAKREGKGNESKTVEVLAMEGEASRATASATWRRDKAERQVIVDQVYIEAGQL